MKTATAFPTARLDGIVTTESDGEVLAYDTVAHQIHHLNGFVANVWRACDGSTSIETIAATVSSPDGSNVTLASAEAAIAKLATVGLLEFSETWRVANPSRRRFLKRTAIASAVAIPAIVSISAPTAAGQGSSLGCGDLCEGRNSQCNSQCSQCGYGSGPGQPGAIICCNPGGGGSFICSPS